MIRNIRNTEDVKLFTLQLVEEGTNVHPDEDFHNYVNIHSGLPAYTPDEAEKRNRLMRKSFKICAENKVDIYNLMQEVFLKATGLDQFIPLPGDPPHPDF